MSNLINLQQQAEDYLAQNQYSKAIALYEQCIEAAPTVTSNYWKLGLALLLEAKELEVQIVWLSVIATGTSEEIDTWTEELIKTPEAEAFHRLQLGNLHESKRIFHQIIELNLNNRNALVNLGFIFGEQGKLEKAISFY